MGGIILSFSRSANLTNNCQDAILFLTNPALQSFETDVDAQDAQNCFSSKRSRDELRDSVNFYRKNGGENLADRFKKKITDPGFWIGRSIFQSKNDTEIV